MVEDRITDGKRIAQLLSSELDGREDGGLERVAVTDADRDVEPTTDGARAYDVTLDTSSRDSDSSDDAGTGTRLAQVFVQEDRARLEFEQGQDVAAEAAGDLELRVRPKATQPPRTLVFVESGAEVKRATDVVQEAVRSVAATD